MLNYTLTVPLYLIKKCIVIKYMEKNVLCFCKFIPYIFYCIVMFDEINFQNQ